MKRNYVGINVDDGTNHISVTFHYIKEHHSVKIMLSKNEESLEVEIPFISLKQLYDWLTEMVKEVLDNQCIEEMRFKL